MNLQWFLRHQETPQNLISTAVLIFQVGIVVACIKPSEANAAFLREARDEGRRKNFSSPRFATHILLALRIAAFTLLGP